MGKFIALLDENTGNYYGGTYDYIILQDNFGVCLVQVNSNKKVVTRSNLIFDDALDMYEYIYQLNIL